MKNKKKPGVGNRFPVLTKKEKEELNARTRARLGPDWETTREEVRKRWGI